MRFIGTFAACSSILGSERCCYERRLCEYDGTIKHFDRSRCEKWGWEVICDVEYSEDKHDKQDVEDAKSKN